MADKHAYFLPVQRCYPSKNLGIIEDYHNNKNIRRAHEGHAGGGRETIIQFVVAILHIYYTCLELLPNCQRCFKFLCNILLRFGLTVTEINIKKVQKQDLKNIKNVKRCRDGMPKSMQTR